MKQQWLTQSDRRLVLFEKIMDNLPLENDVFKNIDATHSVRNHMEEWWECIYALVRVNVCQDIFFKLGLSLGLINIKN